ncbi:MAG: hypothetical protein IKW71_01895, partial [Elusimicrobiaceae bacterium]|nr:hypothetical protein [Elusimicrobiaceae bacterium]
MKKIIAIWLSINLLALNALPTLAQVPVRQVTRGLTRGIKNQPPAGLIKGRPIGTPVAPAAGAALLNQQLSKAVLNEARLPLDYTHLELLNVQAYTPLARQMLTYPDLATRNRLLRTDFLSCVLKNRASEADKAHAADLYRTDLQQSGQSPVETVTNIASLGIVGSIGDAGLILQAVDQTPDLAAQAVVTAAAARALLRLEAYEQLAKLAEQSTVQPALWDGINTYAQAHQLPLQIASHPRQTIPVEELQHQLQDWGPLNYVAADPRVQSTFLYMNAGKPAATRADKKLSTHPAQIAQEIPPLAEEKISEGTEHFIVAPTQTAAAKTAQQAAMRTEPTKAAIISQAKQWIERLKPQGFT